MRLQCCSEGISAECWSKSSAVFICRSYAARHTIYVPSSIKGTSRDVLATTIACVFPQAVLIRTMQVQHPRHVHIKVLPCAP